MTYSTNTSKLLDLALALPANGAMQARSPLKTQDKPATVWQMIEHFVRYLLP